jgi:hypothetical protein
MPSHKQIKVEPPVRTFGLGSSDTRDLQLLYPASPVYSGEYKDAQVTAIAQEFQDGTISDEGHTFGTVNLDYGPSTSSPEGAPDFADVEVGGGGLPGSPYAPNIAVAPEDPHNPANIPAAGAEVTQRKRGGGGAFNTPPGANADGFSVPKDTAQKISSQKIGRLIYGRSSNE